MDYVHLDEEPLINNKKEEGFHIGDTSVLQRGKKHLDIHKLLEQGNFHGYIYPYCLYLPLMCVHDISKVLKIELFIRRVQRWRLLNKKQLLYEVFLSKLYLDLG